MNTINYAAFRPAPSRADFTGSYLRGQQSRALEGRIQNQNKLAQATASNAEAAKEEAARKGLMQKLGLLAGALYDVKTPEDYQRAEDNLVNLGVMSREDAAQYNYEMLPQIVGAVRVVAECTFIRGPASAPAASNQSSHVLSPFARFGPGASWLGAWQGLWRKLEIRSSPEAASASIAKS